MSYGWWFLVIFLTALVAFGWGTWIGAWASRPRIPVGRLADPAPLPAELPRAARLEADWMPGPQWSTYAHQAFSGAADPIQQMPAPIPWDLAGAAYELGRQRAMQDEVSAEVTAMIAEYDARQAKG